MSGLRIVTNAAVRRVIDHSMPEIIDVVRAAYEHHELGGTVNPPSQFLRFPEAPANRIIALPASVSHPAPVAGVKWISSVPSNVKRNLARASAVLLLNDPETGHAYACMESAAISSARTAASAALAARTLYGSGARHARVLACVGAGLIARSVLDFLRADGWKFDAIQVFDLDPASGARFVAHFRGYGCPCIVSDSAAECIADADMVLFATTATTPHVLRFDAGASHRLWLHLSLRDVAPEVMGRAWNLVDDVSHSMAAATSTQLTAQALGHQAFIAGTIGGALLGKIAVPDTGFKIFSPFGLGVLDVALGHHVFERLELGPGVVEVPDFHGSTARW